MSEVVVIGAGVIGLSCAIKLQEHCTVTIVAKDFPAPFETIDPIAQINYTSPWGGAHNRWVPPSPSGENAREHAYALITYKHMKAIHAYHPEAGITFMKGIEYLEAPSIEYTSLTEARAKELKIEGFRLLAGHEFPDDKVSWGCAYDTWCVNPMVYCCYLLRKFTMGGGRIRKRELRKPEEVFALPPEELGLGRVDAVVNASGYGFGDDLNIYVTKGQTCLVDDLCPVTVTRQNADGSWSFCVPRNFDGGTVIGGTKDVNDWAAQPSMEVREKLLSDFRRTWPHDLGGGYTVLADIVGRRPTRIGGPRIEGEVTKGEEFIMHAYGLGGRGYELSWGVAEAVAKEVERHFI
ncbi:FAD dependent oxidoreductase-like protein [Podospora aff. communis PSN243]|uniref:FAD dependent oxidoreductase-like protein n=1 Tax=Podospora aff. communis PSN243 TaxID=3040156 RepID=A0AAV9H498_9PEZI|nr:FAD dependent oxidoreductase-like protein [Podospora aff. communis PSN243]